MADFAAPAAEAALLTTKLFIPRPRAGQVLRPELVARLNRALRHGHKMLVVSAPPGFGKTTLLSAWLDNLQLSDSDPSLAAAQKSQTESTAVAWLSLDSGDNDPHQFLAYCLAALQTIEPGIGMDVALPLPAGSPSAQALITVLINQLARLPRDLIFVLDDFHLIEAPIIHDGLAFLLENLPARLRLVLASRSAMPFSLARLRGRGQLTELTAADLRFSPAEAAAFLSQTMGLSLSPDDVALLEEKTEGWIAGLQLAALSLHGRPQAEASGFIRAFSGSHRHIFDYLLEETLQRQPAAVQQFLLTTSLPDRLCGPLCDALLAASPAGSAASGAEMLARLEQANLFVLPLDAERRWYRYHHLFADLLRHRLAQSGRDAGPLHRAAADWFEQHGYFADAMRHALAAADVPRVLRLARQNAAPMLSRNELETLLSWLSALPAQLFKSRPGVSLLHAWATVLTGQLDAVEAHLQAAELAFEDNPGDAPPATIRGEVETLRGTVAYFRRDMDSAVVLYSRALNSLPPDNLYLRGGVIQSLGAAYSWLGRVSDAVQAFQQASVISQQTGQWPVNLIACWNLGQLWQEQGQLQRAADVYRDGLSLAAQLPAASREQMQPQLARLHLGLALPLLEWNQLDDAARQVTAGLKLAQARQDTVVPVLGLLLQSRLALHRQQFAAAQQAVQQAAELTRQAREPYFWGAQVEIWQARLWLAQGNLAAVARWAQERGLALSPPPAAIAYLQEGAYLVLARLLLAQADAPTAALSLSRPLAVAAHLLKLVAGAAQDSGRLERRLEAQLLQALVQQRLGQPEMALAALAESLRLGEPEGYTRIFISEGAALAPLLAEAARRKLAPAYTSALLAALNAERVAVQAQLLLEPLSERELEILRLIATGMSNKDLADELVLTVGTVKWHLNNIYGKLAVRSRTQAVAKARELGLV